ncbi:MAG: hypothetical protein ABI577_05650 [bacterium]
MNAEIGLSGSADAAAVSTVRLTPELGTDDPAEAPGWATLTTGRGAGVGTMAWTNARSASDVLASCGTATAVRWACEVPAREVAGASTTDGIDSAAGTVATAR